MLGNYAINGDLGASWRSVGFATCTVIGIFGAQLTLLNSNVSAVNAQIENGFRPIIAKAIENGCHKIDFQDKHAPYHISGFLARITPIVFRMGQVSGTYDLKNVETNRQTGFDTTDRTLIVTIADSKTGQEERPIRASISQQCYNTLTAELSRR